MPIQRHNVYVGTETGILKGVQLTESGAASTNFHNLSALERQHEVCCLAWGDAEQRQVLLGLRSQQVKVYDTQLAAFTMCRQLQSGAGPVIGLGKHQGAVITAVESGVVTLWRFEAADRVSIDALQTGERLCRMRQSSADSSRLATGGLENDLQLWDLHRPDTPIFRAKNVRPDMLDLRVPVWVSDITFMEDPRHVATCHRHSAVRLYDVGSGRRRPVTSFQVADDEPLTCISRTHRPHQVVVGSGRGRLQVCDLRMGRPLHALKGLAGGVREVVAHPSLPYSVAVSLDRFLLLHNLDTRQLVHKVYLKSRLSSVLMRNDFSLDADQFAEAPAAVPPAEPAAAAAVGDDDDDDDLQIVEEFLEDVTPALYDDDGGGRPEPEPTAAPAPKKKRKLPKLKVSSDAEAADGATHTPRKQKLPKLVDTSSKKKKKKQKSREA